LESSSLDLYLEMEILMASLYERFAKNHDAHADFWRSLVADEREHAGFIAHFQRLASEGKMSFAEGKTRVAALNSVIAYVKAVIDDFDRQPFIFRKAIGICLDLEKSVIERDVFKSFDSDSIELKQLLALLQESQIAHVKQIEVVSLRHRAAA
jgi:hypothetical protein